MLRAEVYFTVYGQSNLWQRGGTSPGSLDKMKHLRLTCATIRNVRYRSDEEIGRFWTLFKPNFEKRRRCRHCATHVVDQSIVRGGKEPARGSGKDYGVWQRDTQTTGKMPRHYEQTCSDRGLSRANNDQERVNLLRFCGIPETQKCATKIGVPVLSHPGMLEEHNRPKSSEDN